MALGAEPWQVVHLVLGQGIRVTLVGLTIGILSALSVTRLMSSVLYAITPTDLPTFLGVAVFLMAVALAACYIPARNATLVDPMVALRHE